jgi:hypothetical protein
MTDSVNDHIAFSFSKSDQPSNAPVTWARQVRNPEQVSLTRDLLP